MPAPGYGVCSCKKVGVYIKDHRCKVLLILFEICGGGISRLCTSVQMVHVEDKMIILSLFCDTQCNKCLELEALVSLSRTGSSDPVSSSRVMDPDFFYCP